MASNKEAIFAKEPENSVDQGTSLGSVLTSAANDYTGVSAANTLVFTAPATEAAYVNKFVVMAIGTNAATNIRFFINNGLDNTVAANNVFIYEKVLLASTASTTVPQIINVIPIRMGLKKGFRIYAGLTVAAAAGWRISVDAGNY